MGKSAQADCRSSSASGIVLGSVGPEEKCSYATYFRTFVDSEVGGVPIEIPQDLVRHEQSAVWEAEKACISQLSSACILQLSSAGRPPNLGTL